MRLNALKIYCQYALKGIVQLFFALLALSGVANAESETKVQCHVAQKLQGVPSGQPACFLNYKLSELKASGSQRKLGEDVRFASRYAIAISKSDTCSAIGFAAAPFIAGAGNTSPDFALASCRSQGCECEIAIDDGQVKNFDLLTKFEKSGKSEIAQSSPKSDQSSAIDETKVREEQRRASEANTQQLKVAEEARIRSESGARTTSSIAGLASGKSSEQCSAAFKLTGTPAGASTCLSDYEISNLEAASWGKKLRDLLKNNVIYAVALSKSESCNSIGFGTGAGVAGVRVHMLSAAIAGCKKQGCDCEIAIDDGAVKNFDLLTKFEKSGKFEIAQIAPKVDQSSVVDEAKAKEEQRRASEAKAQQLKTAEDARLKAESEARAKEQQQVLAENKIKEQARLVEEARVKDEQRRLEEARVQKLKLADEARLKAESDARAKEQERVLADNKAREQARLIEEARAKEEQRRLEEVRVQQQLKLAEEARVKAESEARARDQERVLAENKAKEQARIIEEARAKDEQRRLEDARVQQQLKLAEEARIKAESEARAKEQERVLAESKAKERERQLAESKDAELAALRAQLEKMKQQTAKASEAVQMAKRKALIIGNDSYKFISKLANAREDARAVAENLAKVGYTVTLKTDLTEKEMKAAIRTFKSQVEAGDEVAIFYAGHGIQLDNTNYLIPIDVAGDAAEQVKDEAIPLQRVLDDMADRKAKLTLALIDACRDNPFKSAGRSIGQGRGLAPTTAATGQMVVFSAGTGQQALDNLGPSDKEKNGIFTRIFIREMTKPDRTVDAVVRQVRNEVVRMAKSVGHEQVPAIYDQVVGEFYFARSGQ